MIKKLALFYLMISVCLTGNLGAETIVNHLMTRDPNSGTGCEKPIPNYTFSRIDRRAYCWIDVDDIIEGDLVEYEWYDPNSALYTNNTHTMSFTGNGCAWNSIEIRNDIPANMPGEWHVDVFYNGTYQFTENFTILEGFCPVVQIYGDRSKKTQLLRTVRDQILQATPEGRELISLYYQWAPAILKAMESDEAFRENLKGMIDEILISIIGKE